MKRTSDNRRGAVVVVCLLLVIGYAVQAFASNIDSVRKYAWGENIGWINFGTPEGNVTVNSMDVTGYAWSENAGWISLNCSNDSSCGTVNYGVARAGNVLSGYAWGENVGWISFNCSNTGSCGTVDYAVTVDVSPATTNGDFSGYAWGENVGWVVFNCATTSSCGTNDYKLKANFTPLPTPVPSPGGVVLLGFPGVPSVSPLSPSASPVISPTTSPVGSPSPTVSGTPPPVPKPPGPPPGEAPTEAPPGAVPGSGGGSGGGVSGGIVEVLNPVVQTIDAAGRTLDTLARGVFDVLGNICEGPLGGASCGAVAIGSISIITAVAAAIIQNEWAASSFFLFQVVGLKRRAKEWGVVYDSRTKRPIPFAKTELLDSGGRILETRFTDRDGRYGFLTSPTSLQQGVASVSMRITKPGYRFPSALSVLGTDYIVYDRIYRGGPLAMQTDTLFNFNVPLDPETPGRATLSDFGRGLFGTFTDRILSFGFYVGLILVPLNYYLVPTTTNLMIGIMFFGINGIQIFVLHRPYGMTHDAVTGKPLAFVLVTLNDASGTRVGFTVSDEYGRYMLSAERGKDYDLIAYTPANRTPQRITTQHIKSSSHILRKGWITVSLHV